MNIEIYSKNDCYACTKAKNLLTSRGFKYVEFNINLNYTVEELREKFPNAKTVPQIMIDGQHIAGSDKLEEWMIDYDNSSNVKG